MPRKQKVSWSDGAVFGVPLPDGSLALGQAVTLMWPNVVYCALTGRRLAVRPEAAPGLRESDVVARVALTREQLDYGAWPVLGITPPICRKYEFPNERFAAGGYVGAKVYDAAVAEEFLAAFHALVAWDDWHDPAYLDAWLVSPDRKPAVLKFKSDAAAT